MKFFKRISFDFCFEKTWKGKYKKFNILPVLMFIQDTQFKESIYEEPGGWIEYELWFDWFIWQMSINLIIKNK